MAKNKIKVVEKKLGRENALGQAWIDDNLIELESRQSPKEKFSTTLHELFHMCNEEFTEKEVLKYEKIMIDVLWKLGYRKVDLK